MFLTIIDTTEKLRYKLTMRHKELSISIEKLIQPDSSLKNRKLNTSRAIL